jgi:hypothetical protein
MTSAKTTREDTRGAEVIAEPVGTICIFLIAVDSDHDVVILQDLLHSCGTDCREIERINSLQLHALHNLEMVIDRLQFGFKARDIVVRRGVDLLTNCRSPSAGMNQRGILMTPKILYKVTIVGIGYGNNNNTKRSNPIFLRIIV